MRAKKCYSFVKFGKKAWYDKELFWVHREKCHPFLAFSLVVYLAGGPAFTVRGEQLCGGKQL